MRMNNTLVYVHLFNLAKTHTDLLFMLFCNIAMSFSVILLDLRQHRFLDVSFTGVMEEWES